MLSNKFLELQVSNVSNECITIYILSNITWVHCSVLCLRSCSQLSSNKRVFNPFPPFPNLRGSLTCTAPLSPTLVLLRFSYKISLQLTSLCAFISCSTPSSPMLFRTRFSSVSLKLTSVSASLRCFAPYVVLIQV